MTSTSKPMAVICSCNTHEQLAVAVEYAKLASVRYTRGKKPDALPKMYSCVMEAKSVEINLLAKRSQAIQRSVD